MAEQVADLGRARDAVEREDWAGAYAELTRLDPSVLEARDLEGLADAAWWLGKPDESLAARHRAYAAATEAVDEPKAAADAARLAIEHFQRGEAAVGTGWLGRARRHLEGLPEGIEHGLLAVIEATVARYGGNLDLALKHATTATDIGRRFADPNVWALGLHTQGLVLIAAGRVVEGVPLLDEAMTSVVAGQLSSYFTGVVYCNVIGACLQLADVGRAGEWSDAAKAWCESIPPESPYPGLCRINRAEVADLRGAWAEAEAEAKRASEELMRFDSEAAAHAFYETGEIRRRRGDPVGAHACFTRARELGFDPQPGAALLRLAAGDPEAALAALRISAKEMATSPLRRARLLVAIVDSAIAAGEEDAALEAAAELDELATGNPTPALTASAVSAGGAVALAGGDAAEALARLRRASALWRELRLPYEGARARALLGTALRLAGDEEGAVSELRAALATFERLGAAPDAARMEGMLGRPSLPAGLTQRQLEVLRLVATGESNREIARALVISEHTVARHVQNIFVKLNVSSRAAATAFAFEHDLT